MIARTVREIIHQADQQRNFAEQADRVVGELTAAEGRVIEVTFGGPVPSTKVNIRTGNSIDVRTVLVDVFTRAAASFREEADALEAQIQLVDLR
jgi:hypothetical protein